MSKPKFNFKAYRHGERVAFLGKRGGVKIVTVVQGYKYQTHFKLAGLDYIVGNIHLRPLTAKEHGL